MSTRLTREEERLLKRVFAKRVSELKKLVTNLENLSRTEEMTEARKNMILTHNLEIAEVKKLERKILEL
jgi:hypothetical protein